MLGTTPTTITVIEALGSQIQSVFISTQCHSRYRLWQRT